MVSYPGDLTPEQRAHWIGLFRKRAEERWGAERVAVIGDTLDRTSIAIGRMDSIMFVPSDLPAFFLNDAAPGDAEGHASE